MWTPLGIGSQGSTREGTTGPHTLVVRDDGTEGSLNSGLQTVLEQKEFFEIALDDVDAVLEVGFTCDGCE